MAGMPAPHQGITIVGDQMDNTMKTVYETVKARDPSQHEFHQAVEEVLDSIGPVLGRIPNITM